MKKRDSLVEEEERSGTREQRVVRNYYQEVNIQEDIEKGTPPGGCW